MSEEGRKSAQCAWLFCHAHLIGELCIQFNDGLKIHFGSSALEDAFSLTFVLLVVVFFTVAAFFLPVLAGFVSLERRAAALAFASILRCCLARSSRRSSSWWGLSTSMHGSA